MATKHKLDSVLCLMACMTVGSLGAQFIKSTSNLPGYYVSEGNLWGNGLSWWDFDQDGWDDLTLADGSETIRFLRNNEGQLEDYSIPLPLSVPANVISVQWIDFDNDGDSDFFFTQRGGHAELWLNDGNFGLTNITGPAGLPTATANYHGASWADYNHDGFLDLFVAKYNPVHTIPNYALSSRLYRSNGDGTFTDATFEAGMLLPQGPCFEAVWFDYDSDGWEDLYWIVDRTYARNELFRNNGDGTFSRQTDLSGTGLYINSMTGSMSDYNADGDLDVYVTNTVQGNSLLDNNGDGTFSDVAGLVGLLVNRVCWGALWIDFDNNRLMDIMVGTTNNLFNAAPNYFYIQNEHGHFVEAMAEVGIESDNSPSFTVSQGDLNNDGYYDFVTGNNDPAPTDLWVNQGGTNHWIGITLEGTYSNRDGIGSWIHLYSGGQHFVRYTNCGENFLAQDSRKEIFGLGEWSTVDSIVIHWSRGTIERYIQPETDKFHHFTEGRSFEQPFTLLPPSTRFCPGGEILLDGGDGVSWLWNTGDTTRQIQVSSSGVYFVQKINIWGFSMESEPIEIIAFDVEGPQISVLQPSCAGMQNGIVTLESEGEIMWNHPDMEFSDFFGAGQYDYQYLTPDGCLVPGILEIIEPLPLSGVLELTPVNCFGFNSGTAEFISLEGGTGTVSVDWNGIDHDNLHAGMYTVRIIDDNGCVEDIQFSITEPDQLILEVEIDQDEMTGGNLIQATIIGGTPPYQVLWSDGTTEVLMRENLEPGLYNVEVTDAHGCTAGFTFTLHEALSISGHGVEAGDWQIFPNPVNEKLHISHVSGGRGRIMLKDTAGRLILDSTQFVSSWLLNFEPLAPGIYYVIFSDENQIQVKKIIRN